MSHKNPIALITGATSGIGKVILDHLVSKNFQIILLARSEQKVSATLSDLKSKYKEVLIDHYLCDLSSFEQIKKTCDDIKKNYNEIGYLILNAGIWNFEFFETEDGIENTFQVNLLSPIQTFKEMEELIPKDGNSKVIFTSSGLHQGEMQFEDLEFRNKFSGFKAYRQSKLGIILLTRHLAKLKDYEGISFYNVHPGLVNTELGRSAGWFSKLFFKLFGKSPEKGAQTHIHLIDTPNTELISGEYYANSAVKKITDYSYNMKAAEKLWGIVEEYLKKL